MWSLVVREDYNSKIQRSLTTIRLRNYFVEALKEAKVKSYFP